MGQRWVFTPFTMASAVQIFQSPSCQGSFLYNEGTRTKRTKRGTPGIIICDGWSRGSSLRVPLTCGITFPAPAPADADRQTGPSTMRASISGYIFTVGLALQKASHSRSLLLGLSSLAVCSPEVERGEPENTSSYSISTRLSQAVMSFPAREYERLSHL